MRHPYPYNDIKKSKNFFLNANPDLDQFRLKITHPSSCDEAYKGKCRKAEKVFRNFAKRRARTLAAFREAAEVLDNIAQVKKGLEVGGGATSLLGGPLEILLCQYLCMTIPRIHFARV